MPTTTTAIRKSKYRQRMLEGEEQVEDIEEFVDILADDLEEEEQDSLTQEHKENLETILTSLSTIVCLCDDGVDSMMDIYDEDDIEMTNLEEIKNTTTTLEQLINSWIRDLNATSF